MKDARNFQQSRDMKDDAEDDASPEDAKPFIENANAVARQASSSSGSDEERRSGLRGRGVSIGVVAVIGSLVAIVICTAAGLVSSKTSPVKADGDAPVKAPAVMTARQLFVSDGHVDVVTDNVMALAKGALDSDDRDMVRDHVASRFQDMSKDLAQEHPEASRAWDIVQLNSVQQAAVLRSMKAMGDPRMEHLGQEMGEALHAGLSSSDDKNAAKRQLADLLAQRLDTIRELHEEVCPRDVPLCDEGDESEGVQVRLEKKSVQLTDTLRSNWKMELDMSKPEVSDQAVTLPARRLKSGKGGKGSSGGFTLTSGLKLMTQFQSYFGKIKKFCKTLGITVPDLSDALKEVDVGDLLSCVAQNAVKAKATSMFKCGQKFAEAAENVVATLVGGGKKPPKGGKGHR